MRASVRTARCSTRRRCVCVADLSLDLCGVKLKNPIIAASGTFGFGREYDELYDIGQLGGISVKGLSLLPRTGNPPSRIAETPSGMLNSVGLQNPGVKHFIKEELPYLLDKGTVIIAVAADQKRRRDRQHHGHERGTVCADGRTVGGHGRASAGNEYFLPKRA